MAYHHHSLLQNVPAKNLLDHSDDTKQRYAFLHLYSTMLSSWLDLSFWFTNNLYLILCSSPISPSKYLMFLIHFDGYFTKDKGLQYEDGTTTEVEVSKSRRMGFEAMLDMVNAKTFRDIRSLFYCCPSVPLHKGLTLVESQSDMEKLYDTAELHDQLHLYVLHLPQNLAEYYYGNLTLQGSDEHTLATLQRHASDLAVAKSKSYAQIAAWEDAQHQTPPLRTPPSPPRSRGRLFEGKNLFNDFLHADHVVDEFYFSDEDIMPGIPGVHEQAMDAGWSTSDPSEWINTLCSIPGSKLPNVCPDSFDNEVHLDVDGSPVVDKEGTRVQRRKRRRFPKKKKTRSFYFGSRRSPLRRLKMLRLFRMLHRQRVIGGIQKNF